MVPPGSTCMCLVMDAAYNLEELLLLWSKLSLLNPQCELGEFYTGIWGWSCPNAIVFALGPTCNFSFDL